ncbi:hypothetical protein EKL98_12565 [Flavobacterium bomense]|uniref:Uncharacterized protein n=1 Tax=Flavobacterium bomense TaxID=2497483 RepID=A0A432CHR8_9FLAO|nr:DUF5677 domain-containing protein [Flavobacterium bomense]RTZ02693.1 hypothetical protein EKL98_12565 [Flavobacterium bomense]
MAKKKSRIRQTRTSFQKVFDNYPGMIQSFSWSDRLPEFLHISIALIDNDYEVVKKDFHKIANFVNEKINLNPKFHFNLTHTLKIITEDNSILDEILKTSFKDAFQQIILFYDDLFNDLLNLNVNIECEPDRRKIFLGYKSILHGRLDTSILCKYIMMQYTQAGNPDPFHLFGWETIETILDKLNVSKVMSAFPPSIGLSENLDLEFCENIWLHNYYFSPKMPKPDDTMIEEQDYADLKIEELNEEFISLFSEIKQINLLEYYNPYIAEVNMGFIARIGNLTIDTIDLVKIHKGEIAEMVYRVTLETFIVGSWLLTKQDIELHKRFRDFSTGRQRFFGEQILQKAPNDVLKKEAKSIIDDAIAESGKREIDVATEKGDVFDKNIMQMSNEVWGEENIYYFLYKRSSEVTHGRWEIIAKYHLAKSHNPVHNGLYFYNENPNRFAGLIPAFGSLILATDFLIRIIDEINDKQHEQLREKLNDYHNRVYQQYMVYYNDYCIKK